MALFDDLNQDAYRPPVIKPELNQWDNYGIHDLYCTDITFEKISSSGTREALPNKVFQSFLAVQHYDLSGKPEIDFEAIALAYP